MFGETWVWTGDVFLEAQTRHTNSDSEGEKPKTSDDVANQVGLASTNEGSRGAVMLVVVRRAG